MLLGRGLGGRSFRSRGRGGPRGRIGGLCFRDWGRARLGIAVRGLLRTYRMSKSRGSQRECPIGEYRGGREMVLMYGNGVRLG